MVFSGTLDVCRAFFSDPKVDTVGEAAPANSTSLRGGRAGGDVDPVETPDLVTEDDPRSQASHPSDGLLPGAGGNLPRRDSARNGRESQEGLGGGAEAPAPAGGAAGGVGRRSMGELARLSGSTASCYATQAPSDSTQAATAPEGEGRALAGSAATNAGAWGSAFTAGACGSAPVGGTFANTAARVVAPPSWRAVSRCCTVWTMAGHGLGARSSATTLVSEGPLGNFRASGPLTQHNAQSRHAPHFSLCCSLAVQVLRASVHSSLDLKHFTAGDTNSELGLQFSKD